MPKLEKKLTLLAKRYRKALEAVAPTVDHPAFSEFPRGACGPTAELLAHHLLENGVSEVFYCCGTRADGQSHAWVEVGELIIDITGSQFKEQKAPVLVTSDRTHHDDFLNQEKRLASQITPTESPPVC